MTLNKIINVALLALVIWFGYTQLLPWLRSLGEIGGGSSFDAGTGEDAECVEAARQAADVFAEVMREFSRPPIDAHEWDNAYLRVENRIARAEDLCACSRPACSTARSGLSTLRDLGGDFTSAARREGAPPINAASSMSRVYDDLDAAASLSRGILE